MPLATLSTRRAAFRRAAGAGLLVAISLAASVAGAIAQTVYVDNQNPAATDLGTGTELQPYATILAAVTANKGPGVTVLVNPGVYREQVSVPASGAAGLPYTIRATGPGAVIDGSDDFSGTGLWAPASGTEFRAASVTWSPAQVFVDGSRLAASASAPGSLPANSFAYVAGQGLYVNLGGDDPGAHATFVSRRNYAFTMATRSFVTIDGFAITRTNDRGINIHTCADLVISNNRVEFSGSYGIQAINSQRVRIEGNTVTDAAFHGIGLTAGSTACTVAGNESARNAHPVNRVANGIYLFGAPGNALERNRLHHNQDSGMYLAGGSDACVSFNNRSWANGDHGYDHLGVAATIHVHDVAHGNLRDGFSYEGLGSAGRLHNSISVDNGIATNRFDLWVDAASLVDFASDHNVFWNSTGQAIIRTAGTIHTTLVTYQGLGLDPHSMQLDPLFTDPASGDFTLAIGSPAIDAAASDVAQWPATDAAGNARVDDQRTANSGTGPVPYADLGALEHIPADVAPVVASPKLVKVVPGGTVSFTVTASDPDGDPIQSLVLSAIRLPAGHAATFVPNADNTGGTFTWPTGATAPGNYFVEFVASNWLTGSARTHIQIQKKRGVSETGELLVGPLALSHGHPNPSAATVEFTLSLPEETTVEWGVYDMQGREIWSESRTGARGSVTLSWSGLDRDGRRAPTGMYFARVRVGETRFVRRIVRF